MQSRLEPIKAVARMVDRRLDNIMAHYHLQLPNAVTEGLNCKMMAINRRVGDYRNVGNSTDVINFYCGGLQLYSLKILMVKRFESL